MEWALRVMGFTCGVEVKRLEINCAAGLAILFGTTMQWHNVTGSPTGAGSRTPSDTSWSSPALILLASGVVLVLECDVQLVLL